MTRARLGSSLVWLLLGLVSSGCELVADFDRSRIPVEAADSGAGGLPDGSLLPPTAGSPAADAGTSVTDSGSPGDAAAAPDAAPALDAGTLDAATAVDAG